MRPKSLLLLVMALGCGLVAAVGINQILATPSNDAETTNIVVARREIHRGDHLKPDDIRLQEWRVDALPPGSIQKVDDLAERRVKHNLVPGEPILESKLVGKEGIDSTEQIPAGMKAVSVKVDAESGNGGLVLPGDNVDVIVHAEANAQKGIPSTFTKVLLKNIKVHAVDDTFERDGSQASIAAKTIALIVTPREALLLSEAAEMGKIRLMMRSSKDDGTEDDTSLSVTPRDVFGDSLNVAEAGPTPLPPTGPGIGESIGKGVHGLSDLLAELGKVRSGIAEPEEKPFTMKLIEGGETKEVEFSKDSRSPQPVGGPAGMFDRDSVDAVEPTPSS